MVIISHCLLFIAVIATAAYITHSPGVEALARAAVLGLVGVAYSKRWIARLTVGTQWCLSCVSDAYTISSDHGSCHSGRFVLMSLDVFSDCKSR